jgi:predicted transcriptional regulator
MIKHGIDQEALISKFSEASARQGEAIRKTVTEATLKALQGRELTLKNIKQVLETVAKAASTGAAGSALPAADVQTLLAKAVAGMDGALEKAVQANRTALQQIIDRGADLRETQVKKALGEIEKMEDALFAALRKAADGSQASLEGPWAGVLKATQGKGTGTGAQASATITQLMDSAQSNLKRGRALGLSASQAMFGSYATFVSGVLIGMSDALQQGGAAPAPSRTRRK